MKIRFLETHGDLFIGGKNLKNKHRTKSLTTNTETGLEMEWNEEKERVEITWNAETGWVFPSNIALLVPEIGKVIDPPKNEHRTESVEGRRRAQVSTPTGHVFDGAGKGKTRQ